MVFLKTLSQYVLAYPIRVFAMFYVACALFIVATADYRGAIGSDPLAGDGFYYYVYARSILIDQDVNFKNEYEKFSPADKPIVQRSDSGQFAEVSGGFREYPENYFAIGSGILWLPAVSLVHYGLLGLQYLGVTTQDANGFSQPYIVGVGVIGCFYAFLSIVLIFRMLRLNFSNDTAILTCLFIATATSMINYVIFDPMYGHVNELFMASLVLYLCMKYPSFHALSVSMALLIGLAIGAAALVRWQVILFGLAPFIMWVRALHQSSFSRAIVLKGVVLAAGALLAFSPQLLAWNSIYGSYLTVPQGGGFFVMRWFGWLQVLLSNHHGMFYTHPITGVAFVGLFFAMRASSPLNDGLRVPVIVAFTVFVLQTILNGVVLDVGAGASFGMRRMINVYPILAIGLAAFIVRWDSAGSRSFGFSSRVLALWFFASCWNVIILGVWLFRLGGDVFPR